MSIPSSRFAPEAASGRPACAAVALLVVLACLQPACGPDREQDREAIRTLIEREVEALNRADLRALSDIWSQADDITLVDVPPPGRFEGWTEIAKVFREFFDQTSEIHVTVADVRIRLADEMAYATYGWSMVGRFGDRPLIDRGQATAVYRREAEGWRLVHAHYSPVPPALALEAEREPPADEGAAPAEHAADAGPGDEG